MIVEAPGPASDSDEEDEVVVIEEHDTPPPRRASRRGAGGRVYRDVDVEEMREYRGSRRSRDY